MDNTMKSMTIQQYAMLVQYIQANHGAIRTQWDDNAQYRRIKYIDSCYDTRDGSIWSVTLRGPGLRFSSNMWVGIDKPTTVIWDNLYDWIMAYLDHAWEPTENELKYMTVK